MSQEDDWKELELWNASKEEDEKKRVGFDYKKADEEKQRKQVDKVVRGIRITGKTFITIVIIFSLLVLAYAGFIIYVNIAYGMSKINVNVQKTIEKMYQTKIKILSKNVDDNKDGIYYIETKNEPKIQFTAIKKKASLKEDYLCQCLKYYFNHWDSPYKAYFTVNETIENGLLKYELSIPIQEDTDIEPMVKIMSEFVTFCGENNLLVYHIYLTKDFKRIYPYYRSGLSQEEAMSAAKKEYEKLFEKKEN